MRHCKSRFSRGKHLCMCLGSLLTLFSSACLVQCCLYLGNCTIHITNYGKVISCSNHGNLSLPHKKDLIILYHAYWLQLLQHRFNFILQAVQYEVEHFDTWIYLVCPVSSGKRLWGVFRWRFGLCIILPGKEQFDILGDNPVGFVVASYWKIHLCLHCEDNIWARILISLHQWRRKSCSFKASKWSLLFINVGIMVFWQIFCITLGIFSSFFSSQILGLLRTMPLVGFRKATLSILASSQQDLGFPQMLKPFLNQNMYVVMLSTRCALRQHSYPKNHHQNNPPIYTQFQLAPPVHMAKKPKYVLIDHRHIYILLCTVLCGHDNTGREQQQWKIQLNEWVMQLSLVVYQIKDQCKHSIEHLVGFPSQIPLTTCCC